MIRPTSLSFFALFLGTAISGCGGGNGVQAPDTGSIRVTTSTAGENLDPNGYACRVDGGASSAIGINDSHTFSDVRTGEHTVELTGIANNCTVGGDNPRTVAILLAGQTATANFNVTCEAMTGSLAVTIVTEGDTLDPDGYMVTLDGNQNRPAGVIDIVTFTDLPQGAHSIELSGIAKNCIVIGANPRNVNITAGQLAEATYDVTCAAAFFDRILFNSDRTGSLDVYVMTPDGSNVTQVTDHPWDEHSVDVSPNGTKIAFTGDWDGNEEIHRMNVDGTDPVNLTNSATRDTRAAWSPDGSKIAFQSDREGAWEIYVMNSDGSGLVRLTHNDVDDGGPTWSPDGNEIAFSSERDGWGQIYVMRSSDGANVRRVTNNQDNDGTPMWSPDGTRIAFHKNRQDNFDIYVINVDGSNEQRLTDDPAFDGLAKWSPDSERIVFASGRDGDFEVYIMNADGSGQTRLTFDGAHDSRPRWAPAR
jgi:dipeptidyl aminopeptidase/acylaminoacyl peptidase